MEWLFGKRVPPQDELAKQVKYLTRLGNRTRNAALDEQQLAESIKTQALNYLRKKNDAMARSLCQESAEHERASLRLFTLARNLQRFASRVKLATLQAEIPRVSVIVARCLNRLNREVPTGVFNLLASRLGNDIMVMQQKTETMDTSFELANEATDEAMEDEDMVEDTQESGKSLFGALQEMVELELKEQGGIEATSLDEMSVALSSEQSEAK